ncbi:MAG: hypothetical protein ACRDBM_03205, partial [Sporomusa sp.]
MKLDKQYFGRFSSFVVLSIFWLILGSVLRLGLIVFSYDQVVVVTVWDLLKILVVGGLFDIVVIPQALLPVLLYVILVPRRFFDGKFNKGVTFFLLWLSTALFLLGAIIEFYFWQEFQARFNFIAVDYLVYTQEVWGMIRDSYPLVPILAGIGIVAALLTVYFNRKCLSWQTSLSVKQRFGVLALVVLFPVVVFFSVNGNMKNISSNINNNELAGNGLYELFSAFRNNELDYNRFYRTEPQDQIESTLRQLLQVPNSKYRSEQPWQLAR